MGLCPWPVCLRCCCVACDGGALGRRARLSCAGLVHLVCRLVVLRSAGVCSLRWSTAASAHPPVSYVRCNEKRTRQRPISGTSSIWQVSFSRRCWVHQDQGQCASPFSLCSSSLPPSHLRCWTSQATLKMKLALVRLHHVGVLLAASTKAADRAAKKFAAADQAVKVRCCRATRLHCLASRGRRCCCSCSTADVVPLFQLLLLLLSLPAVNRHLP
jgi:hypothetical protein